MIFLLNSFGQLIVHYKHMCTTMLSIYCVTCICSFLLTHYFEAVCLTISTDNMYSGDNTTTFLDEGSGTFIRSSLCYFWLCSLLKVVLALIEGLSPNDKIKVILSYMSMPLKTKILCKTVHKYMHASIHPTIHPYIHKYIHHPSIHPYVHTYIHIPKLKFS